MKTLGGRQNAAGYTPLPSSKKEGLLSNGMKVVLGVAGALVGACLIKAVYDRFSVVDPGKAIDQAILAIKNHGASAAVSEKLGDLLRTVKFS